MNKEQYINHIPTDIEEFQNYINETDDHQKAIDIHGFTIYPRDAKGKADYSDKANIIKVINEPQCARWDWTAAESKEWSRFREEYNIAYAKYNTDNKDAKDEKGKDVLEKIINECIVYDNHNGLVQRVSDSSQTVYISIGIFKIKPDILEYETPFYRISVSYEKLVPLGNTEKKYFEKYIQLNELAVEIANRIDAARTSIKELHRSYIAFWEQIPVMQDKADKASNSVFIPSHRMKGGQSEVIQFIVPTAAEMQQRMDDFNEHNMSFYNQVVNMGNKANIIGEEVDWAESLYENDEEGIYSHPLYKEVSELKSEMFGNGNYSVELMSLDSDYNEFEGYWMSMMNGAEKVREDWDYMIKEVVVFMSIYDSTMHFLQDKFNSTEENKQVSAPSPNVNMDEENNPDDIRAETMKRYQADLENDTNTYFDVQDWHIILDEYKNKHDKKNTDIAIKRALVQHPSEAILLLRYARLEADEHNYKKALELIQEAEKLGPPDHPNLYYIKADIYGNLQMPDMAIPLYRKLASQEGEEIKWWRTHSYDNLIEIYDDKKDYDECLKLSKEALKERKEDDYLYSNMAYYYMLTGKPDEAEKLMNDFLKAHPESSVCFERLGRIYSELKQYDKAIECFDKAYNFDKRQNYASVYHKGEALIELEKYSEAAVCFQLCLLNYKLSPEYHLAAGKCYAKLEISNQAIYHYRKALSFNPDSTEALDALKLLGSKAEVPLN
jgi:tetratricopeptide (TPR) repeat protein